MTWNYDLTAAPRGNTKTVEGAKGPREVHVPVPVILASKCGQVITSRWLPKEARWNMFANGEQPIAWQSFPAHPNEPCA